MSKGVVEFDRLAALDTHVGNVRQSVFEASGGQGSVEDLTQRGASDEG